MSLAKVRLGSAGGRGEGGGEEFIRDDNKQRRCHMRFDSEGCCENLQK